MGVRGFSVSGESASGNGFSESGESASGSTWFQCEWGEC